MTGSHGIDDRVPDPPRHLRQLVAEALLVMPHLGVLLFRLLRDPAVPRRRKLVAGAAAAYFVAPVDVIPDFVPVVGSVDDLIFIGLAVHYLLESVPPEAQRAYWEGSEDTLDLVRSVAAWGAEMVPAPLRRFLGGAG